MSFSYFCPLCLIGYWRESGRLLAANKQQIFSYQAVVWEPTTVIWIFRKVIARRTEKESSLLQSGH